MHDLPAFDKVLEALTPLDALIWLVFKLGDRLAHDVREQVDQTSSRLHFCAVRWEREAMLRDFQQRDAEGPDVRCYSITLAGDPLGSHVVRSADESVGVALRAELSADAKVTEFDVAGASEQDVAGFDIAMDNAV